ncbi:BppU family phage baseplate upper protein [Jeotgalibaca porci]|uniref:BppU family phage baseplate upper protein n=1 Tax=Jeotgalibaca porci TaxID=1868793 RepID=UPI0035A10384
MVLERFRQEDLQWDVANKTFYKKQIANTSDQRGRSLQVQILENGSLVDVSGLSLSLSWQTKDKKHVGLDEFSVSSAEAGIFKIYYTTGMLSNMGELDANLVLIGQDFRLVSRTFEIEVESGINEGAIQSSDSFSTLQNALNKVVRIIDGTENVAVLENGSVDTMALADFAVTPPKISESTWSIINSQYALKGLDSDPTQGNILSLTNESVSNAVMEANGVITVSSGGFYFFRELMNDNLKVGDTISVAVKIIKDTANANIELEFRNSKQATDGYPKPLINAQNGWYILENITIPHDATDARIRIDNRRKTGETVIEKYVMQKSNVLRAEIIKDDIKELPKSKLKRQIKYRYPAKFKWKDNPLKDKIFTDGEGDFEVIGFDIEEYIPEGIAYYVDINNGDDSNSGKSLLQAFKTVGKAYSQPDATVIYLAEGIYDRANTLFGTTITKDLALIGLPGHDVIYSASSNSIFTKSTEFEYVYQATRGSIGSWVYDIKNKADLVKVNSPEVVNNTPGSYYFGDGTLYLRFVDDRVPQPDKSYLLSASGDIFKAQGGMDIYLQNVQFIGGNSPIHVQNTPDGLRPRVFGKDCTFRYSESTNNDVVMLQGTALSIFENCKAGKGQKDGFNYHWRNGTIPNAIEINCEGFDNGNPEDGNDQGSTIHDGGNVIRINGAYYGSDGANIADDSSSGTKDTHSLNLGCTGFEAHNETPTRAVNFDCYPLVTMWLDGCTGFGSPYNLSQRGSGKLYVRNSHFDGVYQLEEQEPATIY